MPSFKTPPPGAPDAAPSKMRTGQPVGGLPPDGLPPDALPPDALPPGALPEGLSGDLPMPGPGSKIRMKTMPKMNARPYLKRALKLLSGHKAIVALSLTLSLIMCLLPFVAAAAMGPLFKLLAKAAQNGN